MLLGTSMGGARPKVVVEDEGQLWIAKFNRTDDPWNHARVEHAMLALARECGLTAAASRLTDVAGRDVVLVKRFDREPHEQDYRNHAVIALGSEWRLSPAYDLISLILESMEALVRVRWYAIARGVGVTERDCATIARAFAYDGLRLEF